MAHWPEHPPRRAPRPSLARYLLARLREPSTWRGIVYLIIGLTGADLAENDRDTLVSAGLLLAGFIGAAFPDRVGQK